MTTIPTDAVRQEFKFKGVLIQAPFAYLEGAVLTANEIKFLNRQLISTIGNILAGALTANVKKLVAGDPKATPPVPGLSEEDALAKAIKDGHDGKTWQEFYDAKFAEYEPGVNNRGEGGGSGTLDPVVKLSRQIADGKVRELLAERKVPFSKVKGEVFARLVAEYIEKNAWVGELAKAQVDAIKAAGPSDDNGDLGDLLDNLTTEGDDTTPTDGDGVTNPDVETLDPTPTSDGAVSVNEGEGEASPQG